jgi:lipid A oxidase
LGAEALRPDSRTHTPRTPGGIAWPRAVVWTALVLAAAAWPSSARAEFVLDFFTGSSDTASADVKVRQRAAGNDFTVKDLSFDGKSFEDPPYYGARVAYFFEDLPWLGVGVEFFHFKLFGETGESRPITGTRGGAPINVTAPVDSVVQSFNISHGVNYLTLDVIARYGFFHDADDFPGGRLQLYLGGGLGPVIAHAETRIDNVSAEPGYEVGGLGVQGFAGVRFMLFKYVGLFVEGKITHSNLTVGVARGGEAEVDETTLHVVGGLTIAIPWTGRQRP